MTALVADALVGTVLTFVGLPGLVALPGWQALAVFAYALVACLGVNDSIKVLMIRWRIPNAVARQPTDLTPQIATRAYELYEKRGRKDGGSVQDWDQAAQEIRHDKPKK
jgi:hypothetical protein